MVFQDGVEPMFFEGRSYFKGFSFEEAIEQPQGSQSDGGDEIRLVAFRTQKLH